MQWSPGVSGGSRGRTLAIRGGMTPPFSPLVTVAAGGSVGLFDWGGVQHFPLEISNPRSDHNSNHRIYRAYPGIPYNIGAGAIGGVAPYLYELTDPAPGMTIGAFTGVIDWPNPAADYSPTVRVTDTKGNSVTQTWPITVTTTGFKFIDPVGGALHPTGTGAIGSPWRDLNDAFVNAAATDILVLRNGAHSVAGITVSFTGSTVDGYNWNAAKPQIFIAYPGESPSIDLGYPNLASPPTSYTPCFLMTGDTTYFDGIRMHNGHVFLINWQPVTNRGPIYRRCIFHRHGTGLVSNGSMLFYEATYTNPSYYGMVQECEFHDGDNDCLVKWYSQKKGLIERNTFHNFCVGIEIKADNPQFTIRGNLFYDWEDNVTRGFTSFCIGGNMDDHTSGVDIHHGEINFNCIRPPGGVSLGGGSALEIGATKINTIGNFFVERNTFMGEVYLANVVTADGPYAFRRNVILNADGYSPRTHLKYQSVSDASRITQSEDLTGAQDGTICDSNGVLVGASRATYLHLRGHEVP